MVPRARDMDALVLRTLRYGEADLIAHLFTREAGRRNVIAKGARRPKSRLGARLEPFLAARVHLREGRGDLAIVQSVEVIAAHDHVRASWKLQQSAAAALDLLGGLSVEHAANEPAWHLTANFLRLLDSLPSEGEHSGTREALLTGFELKLLHLHGFAPHLGSCVRCGSSGPLEAWSPADGGVVCSECREAVDAPLDADLWSAAAHAMRTSLQQLHVGNGHLDASIMRAVRQRFVTPMCELHAGFRPRARVRA